MYGEMTMTDALTLPVAEEARIDREMERHVARFIAGPVSDDDRREYNALVMRRTHLVQQMALSHCRTAKFVARARHR